MGLLAPTRSAYTPFILEIRSRSSAMCTTQRSTIDSQPLALLATQISRPLSRRTNSELELSKCTGLVDTFLCLSDMLKPRLLDTS